MPTVYLHGHNEDKLGWSIVLSEQLCLIFVLCVCVCVMGRAKRGPLWWEDLDLRRRFAWLCTDHQKVIKVVVVVEIIVIFQNLIHPNSHSKSSWFYLFLTRVGANQFPANKFPQARRTVLAGKTAPHTTITPSAIHYTWGAKYSPYCEQNNTV